jgi:hypothetical protein
MAASATFAERWEDGIIKKETRAEAAETQRIFTAALTARPDMGEGKIKAPPRQERVAARFGGGYRSGERGTGNYDWFYELHPAEQKRVRENWFGGSLSVDEVEEIMPIREWLALTRGIDAAKAVQRGKDLQKNRYSGRNPLEYLKKGRPEDEGGRYERRDGDRSHGVQFFTDHNGVVHPIRASYENQGSAAKADTTDYGADEAF